MGSPRVPADVQSTLISPCCKFASEDRTDEVLFVRQVNFRCADSYRFG